MHVAVCIKQIPDPETPASVFRVDEQSRKVIFPPGQPLTINPFDEQAMEAALRVRDKHGETVRITAVTLGSEAARPVLKHALAMGADEGVLLSDPAFEDTDSYATALVLAAAIKKLAAVDLVLTGHQAADGDASVVGSGIAELLAWPAIIFAQSLEINGVSARVTRVLDDGLETVEADLPVLVTVSNELGAPRKPNLRETMRAVRKPVVQWATADLGLTAAHVGAAGARCTLERLYFPVHESRCEFIAGNSPHEQALALAQRLQTAKLL